MALFRKKKEDEPSGRPDHEKILDQTLYKLPTVNEEVSWADAVEGTLILGSTGSGKTSGPGNHIAMHMLKAGWGMCILCAKPDERMRWQKYASETGRADDVVVFNKASGLSFNFLQYDLQRSGPGAGEVLNLINTLMALNEQNRAHQGGGSGKGDEKFWDNALRRLMSRTISTLKITEKPLSIANMRLLVSDCFREGEYEAYVNLKFRINDTTIDAEERNHARTSMDELLQSNYFIRVLERLRLCLDDKKEMDLAQMLISYWEREFPKISERTQSIVIESFMGIIEPFLGDGILKSHFSDSMSNELRPETIISDRKIIIVDFPVKEFGLAAIYAATIYKTTLQLALERRIVEKEPNPMPVGLWIDEYQQFCVPLTDSLFQVTARSSWVACVYITQNINNLYFVMGNAMPQARAKSLLGNLNLKYFCSNADAETNNWASNMIGRHISDLKNVSINKDGQASVTKNQQLQFKVSPEFFTTLKTGRKHNKNIVQAVIFKAGKIWTTGREQDNYAVLEFRQG